MMSEDIRKIPLRPLIKGYVPYQGILTEEEIKFGIPRYLKLVEERKELAKKIEANRKKSSLSV